MPRKLFNFGAMPSKSSMIIFFMLVVGGIVAFVLLKNRNKKKKSSPAAPPPATPPTLPANPFAAIILGKSKTSTTSNYLVTLPAYNSRLSESFTVPPAPTGDPIYITQLKTSTDFLVSTYTGEKAYIYRTSSLTSPNWTLVNIQMDAGMKITSIEQMHDSENLIIVTQYSKGVDGRDIESKVYTVPTINGTGDITVNEEEGSLRSTAAVVSQTPMSSIIHILEEDASTSYIYLDNKGDMYSSTDLDFSSSWSPVQNFMGNDASASALALLSISQLSDRTFIGSGMASEKVITLDEFNTKNTGWSMPTNSRSLPKIQKMIEIVYA